MALELLAIDVGKRSFHLYGIDTDGMILSRKVSRAKLAEVVANLAPTAIAMEACASAHYWGRCWLAAGREVRLINPRFVKPFVKGSKNDAVDAEAIFEAALRPTMRFVPVKSTDQQDLQSLHRARDRLICQRTALINHTRGLLAEYGIVLPQGPWRFIAQAPAAVAGADLSELARAIFSELLEQLDDLDRRIKQLDATMVALCRTNETCRRLARRCCRDRPGCRRGRDRAG
jgi:transposase